MLTQEHMTAYRNDGVVRIKNAFSQDWLDEARRSIQKTPIQALTAQTCGYGAKMPP